MGTVSLTLPWRNLSSQPAIVKLDKVFLIVGPKEGEEVISNINILYFLI